MRSDLKSVENKQHRLRVQELCESRGGRPGLSVLMSLTVSVDVKQQGTVLRHWSQFVPNMLTDIRAHEALHYHQLQQQHRLLANDGARKELSEERPGVVRGYLSGV